MAARDIGFEEALELTLERIKPRSSTRVPLWEASGLVLAEDAVATVDSPSLTASTKDGYAVRSADVDGASDERPVTLRLAGVVTAGEQSTESVEVSEGVAVKVMTGAPLPPGADAVVSVEFSRRSDDEVMFLRDAGPGRNVMKQGADVAAGGLMLPAGEVITPATAGFMAAGGLREVAVYPRPRVAVIATGDEVVTPGEPLKPGQLYASNLVTLRAWLHQFRMESCSSRAPDDKPALTRELAALLPSVDVVLTSGGAWKSERDMTPAAVEALGGELVYHRVRLAPGKAVALIVLGDKVVFCLPGGPPSNEMAFLQLVLPALLRLAGRPPQPFPTTRARLTAPVYGGHGDPRWTKFFQARIVEEEGELRAVPLVSGSRLQCQALAEGLIKVPTGILGLKAGDEAEVQLLR